MYNSTDPLLLISYMEDGLFPQKAQRKFKCDLFEYFYSFPLYKGAYKDDIISEKVFISINSAKINYPENSRSCVIKKAFLKENARCYHQGMNDFYEFCLRHNSKSKNLDKLIHDYEAYGRKSFPNIFDIDK